jgi:hypothetical protein
MHYGTSRASLSASVRSYATSLLLLQQPHICVMCFHIFVFLNKAPYGRTLQHQSLYQGPARCALEAYVPRLLTCPSS